MFNYKRKKREKAIKRIRSKQGRYALYEFLVFKSGRYIYVQLLDLSSKKTLKTISSLGLKDELKSKKISTSGIAGAKIVGIKIAEECRKYNIKDIPSFNRANYKFHGVIAAVKDGIDSVFGGNDNV